MRKLFLLFLAVFTVISSEAQKKDSLVVWYSNDTVTHVVHFEKDRYDLRESEQRDLDSFLLKFWTLAKIMVVINGHTDSDGSIEYNERLSENRCRSVSQRLDQSDLTNFDSVIIQPFGESQLLKQEHSKADKAENRRVEVLIIHQVRHEKFVPCQYQNCSKKVTLPQGTVYWVDTCATPNYKECYKIIEYIHPDSVRQGGMHTMDDQGNTLISGGMLKYDLCEGIMKQVHIPINDGCVTPEMNLYRQNEDGEWELIEGQNPEVVTIDGREYYSFPISGSGVINCDTYITLPTRTPKIVFKGKRGLKLDEVRISCDCPLTVQVGSPKRKNEKKVKLNRQCCPELQVYVKAHTKDGETLEMDYGPISRMKPRKSPFACKQEEIWRWFIFRKRKKPVYRFYRVREKDFN